MAEMVVIVAVFVTEGETKDPLAEHVVDRVLDVALVAAIHEAGGQTRDQVKFGGCLAEQQGTTIGGGIWAGEIGHHRTGMMGPKLKPGLDTTCHSKSRCSLVLTRCFETQLSHGWRLYATDL